MLRMLRGKRAALGFTLEGDELIAVYRALMSIADDRKTIEDADITRVVRAMRREALPADTDVDVPAQPVGAIHESGYGHGV